VRGPVDVAHRPGCANAGSKQSAGPKTGFEAFSCASSRYNPQWRRLCSDSVVVTGHCACARRFKVEDASFRMLTVANRELEMRRLGFRVDELEIQ
jgi:hypothetical protein